MNLNNEQLIKGKLTEADLRKPAWPYEPTEAAHAAIDFDDDTRPVPGAGPVVWLAVGAVLFASATGVLLIFVGA